MKLYAGLQNVGGKGRVRLNCAGTLDDLARQHLELRDGLIVELYCDDQDGQGRPDELRVDGVVQFSTDERIWVASIDWASVHHASDEAKLEPPKTPRAAAG